MVGVSILGVLTNCGIWWIYVLMESGFHGPQFTGSNMHEGDCEI